MLRPSVLSTKVLKPALVRQVKECGIDIEEQELIAVQPLVSPEKKLEIERALSLGALVFTSAHAVRALVANDATTQQQPERRIFCLSGKTKDAVQQHPELGSIGGTADNAAALANTIVDQRVNLLSFFCGNRRREELPAILRANQVVVKEVVVYETREIFRKLTRSFDGVLFFSPSAVESFFACNQLSPQAVCFAVGPTTADAIASFAKNKTIVAAAPGQEQMVTALLQYFNQAQNS